MSPDPIEEMVLGMSDRRLASDTAPSILPSFYQQMSSRKARSGPLIARRRIIPAWLQDGEIADESLGNGRRGEGAKGKHAD